MNMDKENARLALIFILTLLTLNFALSWWRYDVTPTLAGYDEAMINDGAIGVARFGELRAPEMEGTPMGRVYGLHMPGFLLLQGAIFHEFKVTPLSLRISSKLPRMAVMVLGLVILRRLWGCGVVSATSGLVVATLWLSDIAGFWIGRQARMEALEELFGLGAVWIILKRPREQRSWWLASALVGLAFTMHMSAILFFIPLALGLWFFRDVVGRRVGLACAVLPLAMLALVWVAAYRERSFEAAALFRQLNSYRGDVGFNLARWTEFASAVRSDGFASKGSLAWLKPIGGSSYCVAGGLGADRFTNSRGEAGQMGSVCIGVRGRACVVRRIHHGSAGAKDSAVLSVRAAGYRDRGHGF